MPRPVSRTVISTTVRAVGGAHVHRSAARCELDRVREQVPDHLLEPLRVHGDPRNGGRRTAHRWRSASRRQTAGSPPARRAPRSSRRSPPAGGAAGRQRSGRRRGDRPRAEPGPSRCARSTPSACATRSGFTSPRTSILVHPSTAVSGVRSSCDSVARNSSLRRFAACACCSSRSRSSASARSSGDVAERADHQPRGNLPAAPGEEHACGHACPTMRRCHSLASLHRHIVRAGVLRVRETPARRARPRAARSAPPACSPSIAHAPGLTSTIVLSSLSSHTPSNAWSMTVRYRRSLSASARSASRRSVTSRSRTMAPVVSPARLEISVQRTS